MNTHLKFESPQHQHQVSLLQQNNTIAQETRKRERGRGDYTGQGRQRNTSTERRDLLVDSA